MGKAEFFDKLHIGADTSAVTETGKDYISLPSSPASDAVYRILESQGDLGRMKTGSEKTSHGQKISIGAYKTERQVVFETGASEVTVQLPDIDLISGTGANKTIKKMFLFTLIKINEQAYSDGIFRRDYIQFPLQELIDLGFYSSPQTARVGFDNAISTLTSFKLKGRLSKGKKKTIEQSAVEVLFTGGNRKRGICTIYLNPRINWELLTAFYTILPRAYFRLSSRAGDLLYYLFYLARIKKNDIAERGYFTISLASVHARLNLIPAGTTKNPKRDALDPIVDAIHEISEACGTETFCIEECYNKTDTVQVIISQGYLKISFAGDYVSYFSGLFGKASDKIAAIEKKRDAIIEKARIASLSKSMEKEHSMWEKEHSSGEKEHSMWEKEHSTGDAVAENGLK